MQTVDTLLINAPRELVWQHATMVERWPQILTHYRWVNRLEGSEGGDGVVEMAAWRPFGGPLKWPTWWLSRMWVDIDQQVIRYEHIDGITTGMMVHWGLEATVDGNTRATIVHNWSGPDWPLIGPFAATAVIGPVFIHGIASRTLTGICDMAEANR